MEGSPLVSVILPAFNARPYIGLSIQSVIDQTYPNWELLICDDASTDGTYEEIKKKAGNDPRIKIFRNTFNLKLLKTRNQMLALASGEFITFQDADDHSDKCRFEKMIREFQVKPELGLLSSQVGYVDVQGNLFRVSRKPTDYRTTLDLIYENNVVGGSNMMIKREALEFAGGKFRTYFDGLSYQDYDLSFLIAQKYECYNLDDVLYYYRQHSKSASKAIDVDRYLAKEVVIHLARQRKLDGRDDLQDGHPEKVDSYFDRLRKPFRDDPSLVYRKYAADFMYHRLFRKAIVTSMCAIKERPLRLVNYRTLLYCLRKGLIN